MIYYILFSSTITCIKMTSLTTPLICVHNFCMIHFNINSFNKIFYEFLEYLQNLTVDFDAIVLSETWQLCGNFNISSYIIYYNGHNNKADVCIVYVKNKLSHDLYQ